MAERPWALVHRALFVVLADLYGKEGMCFVPYVALLYQSLQ